MPYKSFKTALYCVGQLRGVGLFPFSPILHSHQYDQEGYAKLEPCPKCKSIVDVVPYGNGKDLYCDFEGCESTFQSSRTEEYLPWDLAICEAMKDNLTMVFHESAFHWFCGASVKDLVWDSSGCKIEYDWAQKNNVRCVTYLSVIENPSKPELWEDL